MSEEKDDIRRKKRREYLSRPEVKARRKELRSMPESLEKSRAYARERSRAKREHIHEYRKRPENVKKDREYARRRYASRKEELKELQNRSRAAMDPRKIMWLKAKARAKQKNIPFSISIDDIPVVTHCPWFGVELKVHRGAPQNDSYSLDRICPEKGYVPGNVQVLSKRANFVKTHASESDVLRLLQVLVPFLRSRKRVSD